MSRDRVFFILVALALLLTAGVTIISGINTMDVVHRVETLTPAKLENSPAVSQGLPETIPPSLDVFAIPGWVMGFAFIGIAVCVIGWLWFRRYASRARE